MCILVTINDKRQDLKILVYSHTISILFLTLHKTDVNLDFKKEGDTRANW